MTAEAVRRVRETSPFGPNASKVTQTRMVAKFDILNSFMVWFSTQNEMLQKKKIQIVWDGLHDIYKLLQHLFV